MNRLSKLVEAENKLYDDLNNNSLLEDEGENISSSLYNSSYSSVKDEEMNIGKIKKYSSLFKTEADV